MQKPSRNSITKNKMDPRTRRVSLGDKASNQTKMDSRSRRVSAGDKSSNQTKQFLEDDGSKQIPVPKLATPTVVEEEVPQPKDDLRRTKSLNNDWKQGSDDDGAFLAPKMQTQLSLDAHLQKRLKDMNKGRWQRSQFSHSKRKVMSLDEGESPETFEEEMNQQHDLGEMQRLTVGGMKRRVSLSKGGQDEGDPDDDWEPFSPAGVREWKVLSRDDLWDPLELGKMWKTILPEEKQWKPFLEEDEPRGEEEEQWHPFPVDEEWDPFELRERIDKYKAQRTPDRASNASMLSEYDEEQTYDVEPTEKTQDDLVPSPGQGTLEPNFSADPQTSKASEQGSAEVELQRKPSSSQKEVKSFPKDLSQPVASGESLIVLDEEQASSKCDPGPEADGEQLSDCQKQIDPFPEHRIKPHSFGQNMQQVAGEEDLKVLDLNASSINPGPVEAGLQLSDCQKQVEPFPDHLIRPHPSGKNMQQKIVGQEDLNASSSNSDPDENGGKRSSDCQKHVEPFPEHLIKPHPYGRHDKSESFEDGDDLIHTLKSDDGYVSRNPAASGPDLSESDLSSGDTLKSDLSSFLEDAEEELSCIVCFELLMDPHTPKNLECAHVCCVLCLQDLLQKDPHVECPQCRHVTTVAESNAASLKTNLRLRNLAEIYHKHSQGAASDQTSGQCSEHGDRLRYYCQTCNAVVCGTCVCDNHNKSTHDIRDLQDVYAEQTSEMRVVIEMTSKRSQENSNSLSNLKAAMVGFQNLLVLEEDSIDKETQQMIAKIQKAADAKKAVIRKGRQAQLEAMDKKKHKLEMHQGEIQRAIVKAKHEVERNQEWDYVTRHHKMVADITALLGQFKHFGHT